MLPRRNDADETHLRKARPVFEYLIQTALKKRGMVVLLIVAVVAGGIWSGLHLPVDANPDISPTMVAILTDAPALGPEEVEQFVTIPVELGMNGIPKISEVRSISQQGLSVVRLIFEDGTDIYWARAQVSQRLNEIRNEIPEGFGAPMMGPITTGLGEIYQFEVKNAPDNPSPLSIMELRTILDWEIARPLKSVPGIIEVNSFGGELKTFQARIDPDRLLARGIPIDRVFKALGENNSNTGGGYIQRNGEVRVIRGEGLIDGLDQMNQVVLDTTDDGTPIFLRDVGEAVNAPMLRKGAVTRDGKGEAVTAIAYMLLGANARIVVEKVDAEMDRIRAKLAPRGVMIDTYYNRNNLISKTVSTIAHNLAEGGVLVVVVLMIFLGNIRAALIVASIIPLSMLFAGSLMLQVGISGSLMSLGAIDFGLIVDSSVIVIENCVSRLGEAGDRPVRDVIREATLEVRKPVLFGVAIITMVNLPILALANVEGKMFRPMALTLIFALAGSLLFSLTATPVLASFFLKAGGGEKETFPVRWAKKLYEPVLHFVVAHPIPIVAGALAVLGLSLIPASRLGGEFIPKLDEGDIVVVVSRPASASLATGIEQSLRFEKALMAKFPDEIRSVISRTGRPEIGLDPAPLNRTDVMIFLHDYDHWTKLHTKQEMIDEAETVFHETMPGAQLNFSQPIEVRFNEMISGVRADLGVALFGDDLDVLAEKAEAIAASLRQVRGARDVKVQPIKGLPYLRVIVDRERIARYGINASDVLDAVRALGGATVGQVVVGQRRFDLQVRYGPKSRNDLDAIRVLKIADPRGRMIALEDLADIRFEDGIYEIRRKDRHRRALIQSNVRDRDLASFVAAAQKRVVADVDLPDGYTLEWGGTFQNLQSASRRLLIVLPVALAMVFLLLYSTFGSFKLGGLIFLTVPFAATGGITTLWLRGLDFSISAGVGFICLSGVAVLDGLVLISAIRGHIVDEGMAVPESVLKAAMSRLRPVLMTASVASLGFIPMALSTTSGAEVQRPLATVVIGGLITSTLLTLVVLPAIYHWFDPGPIGPNEDESNPQRNAHEVDDDE